MISVSVTRKPVYLLQPEPSRNTSVQIVASRGESHVPMGTRFSAHRGEGKGQTVFGRLARRGWFHVFVWNVE